MNKPSFQNMKQLGISLLVLICLVGCSKPRSQRKTHLDYHAHRRTVPVLSLDGDGVHPRYVFRSDYDSNIWFYLWLMQDSNSRYYIERSNLDPASRGYARGSESAREKILTEQELEEIESGKVSTLEQAELLPEGQTAQEDAQADQTTSEANSAIDEYNSAIDSFENEGGAMDTSNSDSSSGDSGGGGDGGGGE